MKFDRDVYFDLVREQPFGGSLTQEQVDGQNALLSHFEKCDLITDVRHFAYMLATTKHETASTMLPIEEHGKGSGQPYGKPDPETKQTYYGRGFVQLTWRENYARADVECGFYGAYSLEWNAHRALDPTIAANIMSAGMEEGWFRKSKDGKPQNLSRYFDHDTNDPFEAREIINGDKNTVPNWSGGKKIGDIIKGYHFDFLAALEASMISALPPVEFITVRVIVPKGIQVVVEEI